MGGVSKDGKVVRSQRAEVVKLQEASLHSILLSMLRMFFRSFALNVAFVLKLQSCQVDIGSEERGSMTSW